MNYKAFSAIYPNYLDSNKTIKLGRRIAAKDAVPEPTIQDIHEALASLNIRHVIQPHKGYSRDAVSRWDNPGRGALKIQFQQFFRRNLVRFSNFFSAQYLLIWMEQRREVCWMVLWG